jgi:hypothetical protein
MQHQDHPGSSNLFEQLIAEKIAHLQFQVDNLDKKLEKESQVSSTRFDQIEDDVGDLKATMMKGLGALALLIFLIPLALTLFIQLGL